MNIAVSRALVASAGTAAAGLVGLIAGLVIAPRVVAVSYLVAYTAVVAVAVGMLLLVAIAHLSGAVWFVLLRRHAEAVLGCMPALAILVVPLLAWREAHLRPTMAYFHPAFFVARAVSYWTTWLLFSEWLRRLSRRQDAADAGVTGDDLTRVSAAAIPLTALALTFAAIDWMMSLSAGWSSSLYGAYYFAGAMVSALALLAVMAARARAAGGEYAPTAQHFQALGRLTLAFVLFWVYLWYSQFFIIWIANVPREATWLIERLRGGWKVVSLVVLAAGFAVPFIGLILRAARASALIAPAVGLWLLAAHYLDVYWLVVPTARPQWSVAMAASDAAALAFVGGTAAAVAIWRRSRPPIAIGDPMFQWSLKYEAH